MRYSRIPGIEHDLSVICMGTEQMGSKQETGLAWRLLDMYVDMGGNFIDSAHVYGMTGEGVSLSERCVGGWLRSRGCRGRITLATKGAHFNLADHSRRLDSASIFADCESSLRDLGVEHIDLYWLHRDDEDRPVEEIIDSLNVLVKRGCIGALGASNWHHKRIEAANRYAGQSGQLGFCADQPQWSLARQYVCGDPTLVQMDAGLLDFHRRTGMPAVPFSSQAKGFYSKLATGGVAALNPKGRERFAFEPNLRKLPAVKHIAEAHGVAVGAVALAYLTSQPFPVFPIVGISREAYMADVKQGGTLHLTEKELTQLDEA